MSSVAPVAEPKTEPSAAEKPIQADYRLVIEEDEASGAFIYKTLDRRTGEVVSQLPREEVLRLQERMDYAAGAVLNTTA